MIIKFNTSGFMVVTCAEKFYFNLIVLIDFRIKQYQPLLL